MKTLSPRHGAGPSWPTSPATNPPACLPSIRYTCLAPYPEHRRQGFDGRRISYFFDLSKERRCYVARERCVDENVLKTKSCGELTPTKVERESTASRRVNGRSGCSLHRMSCFSLQSDVTSFCATSRELHAASRYPARCFASALFLFYLSMASNPIDKQHVVRRTAPLDIIGRRRSDNVEQDEKTDLNL